MRDYLPYARNTNHIQNENIACRSVIDSFFFSFYESLLMHGFRKVYKENSEEKCRASIILNSSFFKHTNCNATLKLVK